VGNKLDNVLFSKINNYNISLLSPPLPSFYSPYAADPSLTTQALDEALESLVYWYTFGVKLGLPSHKLDMIQQDNHGNLIRH
jgi:hypothetical protein